MDFTFKVNAFKVKAKDLKKSYPHLKNSHTLISDICFSFIFQLGRIL